MIPLSTLAYRPCIIGLMLERMPLMYQLCVEAAVVASRIVFAVVRRKLSPIT